MKDLLKKYLNKDVTVKIGGYRSVKGSLIVVSDSYFAVKSFSTKYCYPYTVIHEVQINSNSITIITGSVDLEDVYEVLNQFLG
ncbi:hypothetical protein [uncultured Methanobrevibacter sp.]|uniref:hypothetical protein n=1 Tax=uncultured Methanobrevibacter sp. TaxID=253161 RepID=UPI0025F3CB71|nr:hypothetical protein [uncultured Methanobrevibacter sp.]